MNPAVATCASPVRAREALTCAEVPPEPPRGLLGRAPRLPDVSAPGTPAISFTEASRYRFRVHVHSMRVDETPMIERLLRSMSRTDPLRPEVLLRLAITLEYRIDQAQTVVREARESRNLPRYRARTAARNQQERVEQATRSIARDLPYVSRTVATLAAEYPSFARLDEAYEILARAHLNAGNGAEARAAADALLRVAPLSRLVPFARVMLGELAFARGDLPDAAQQYGAAAAVETPQNRYRAYALYRAAWTAHLRGEHDAALQHATRALTITRPDSEQIAHGVIAWVLSRELAELWSAPPRDATGRVNTQAAYAALIARGLIEPEAWDVLSALAVRDVLAGRADSARGVTEHLLARHPTSDRRCAWQAERALAAPESADPDDVMAQLQSATNALRALSEPPHGAAARRCQQAVATALYVHAVRWHDAARRSAFATPEGRAHAERASRAYTLLSDHATDVDDVVLPAQSPPGERLTLARALLARADVLRERDESCACGPLFARALDEDRTGELHGDAVLGAAHCDARCVLAAEPLAHEPPRRRALTDEELAADFRLARFSCASSTQGSPPGVIAPNLEDARDAATLARASLHFAAGRLDEAVTIARPLVLGEATSPSADAAVVYVRALQLLASTAPPLRDACERELRDDAARLHARYCTPGRAPSPPPAVCARLPHGP